MAEGWPNETSSYRCEDCDVAGKGEQCWLCQGTEPLEPYLCPIANPYIYVAGQDVL